MASKVLLRRFHAVMAANGIDGEGKEAILEGYGVKSSRELTDAELTEIIETLNGTRNEPDKWRKRVIAAIGSWLRMTGRDESIDIIKGIACRAGDCANFNYIAVSKLRTIYYEFVRKAQVSAKIESITNEMIEISKSLN